MKPTVLIGENEQEIEALIVFLFKKVLFSEKKLFFVSDCYYSGENAPDSKYRRFPGLGEALILCEEQSNLVFFFSSSSAEEILHEEPSFAHFLSKGNTRFFRIPFNNNILVEMYNELSATN